MKKREYKKVVKDLRKDVPEFAKVLSVNTEELLGYIMVRESQFYGWTAEEIETSLDTMEVAIDQLDFFVSSGAYKYVDTKDFWRNMSVARLTIALYICAQFAYEALNRECIARGYESVGEFMHGLTDKTREVLTEIQNELVQIYHKLNCRDITLSDAEESILELREKSGTHTALFDEDDSVKHLVQNIRSINDANHPDIHIWK